MNLIDKRELLNERPENLNPNMNDDIKSSYNKGWNACNSEWISLIKEQPTAYDVDKVIEQLEETFDKWGLDDGKKAIMREMVKRGGEQE